jgi:8-oxo-dGTP diphosphatase
MQLTTLCYIEQDDRVLMLHRIKKKNDINKGKWIGVGGKFEYNESPDQCLLREVREETGLFLDRWQLRGIVTFVYNDMDAEYMHLYTADRFHGEFNENCREGVLRWVAKDAVKDLELWPGDRIFFRLLQQGVPAFSLKLNYHDDLLVSALLDGRPVEVPQ